MSGGEVCSVSVKSMRPLHLSRVLVGRKPQEAVHTVSLLYRICGEAQSSASAQAVESAKGVVPDMDKLWVRKQLLNMEIIREHVWRILLDWPVAQGGQPNRQAMTDIMSLSRRWQKLLDPEKQAYQIASKQPGVDDVQVDELCVQYENLLSQAVFSMPVGEWLSMSSANDLLLWAAEEKTEAARFLHGLVSKGWASLGQSDVAGLPDVDVQKIESLLAGHDAEAFIYRPLLQGLPRETTAFSRCRDHSLVHNLSVKFGAGLLARFVAVLLEVALTVEAMRAEARAAFDDLVTAQGISSGIGVVEAARGRLIHRVQLKGDRIGKYQIVAPTEWNFHPQGALVEGLKNLDATDQMGLEKQAHLLVYAMDPCVGYSLEVKGHA